MRLRSTRCTSVLVFAAAIALPACGRGIPEEDPSVSAASLAFEGSDSALVLQLAGFTGGPAVAAPSPGSTLPQRCDTTPDVVSQVVCAVSVPESMHFEWTGCGAPPGDGPAPPDDFSCPNHAGVPQGEEVHSQGTMDITNTVSLGPVTGGGGAQAIIGCDSTSELTWEQHVDLAMERSGRFGNTASLKGTADTKGTHSLDAQVLSLETALDMTRTLKNDGGEVLRSVRMEGKVSTVMDRGVMPPVRTMNGSMRMDMGEGETGQVELREVERQAPMVCFWPVAGTMVRTDSEGVAHHLVFGPGCGEATLDGEGISLHVGRGGPGGPMGR